MTPLETKVPGIIRNEFFYAFARLCMVAAVPLMGWMLSRAGDIADKVEKQSTALQLMTQEVRYRTGHIEDHEQRLRRLELGVALPR